jgi:hypothetical protein
MTIVNGRPNQLFSLLRSLGSRNSEVDGEGPAGLNPDRKRG